MKNLFLKTVNTLKREGLGSVINKSKNRIKAWKLSKNVDLEREAKRWQHLRNNYKGKRVFLIGNGPSLNKTPLYLLKGEYKMCFNRFNIMLERLNWKPDFFLTTDNLVLSDLVNEFDKIIPNTKYSFFPGIHFRGQSFIKEIQKYDNAYWTIQLLGKGFSENLPKIYPGGSVIYEGFQILKYLGFKTVYLIGVDMNYKIHESVKPLQEKGIDIISQKDDDPNHFDPRYFGKNKKYHQPEKYVIDNTLEDLKYIADKVTDYDFQIINIGFDSKLQCFKKTDFYSVINFTQEEQELIFKDLLNSVAIKATGDRFSSLKVKIINKESEFTSELGSFRCDLKTGLSLINKVVFSHIPVGPLNDEYYFIQRIKNK